MRTLRGSGRDHTTSDEAVPALAAIAAVVAFAGCGGPQKTQQGMPCRDSGPRIVGHDFDVTEERAAMAREVSADGDRPVAVVIAGDQRDDFLLDSEIRSILDEYFDKKLIRIGSEYDEDIANTTVAERRRDRRWDVCLDQYLQLRNGALTYEEIRLLRRLGIKRTPAVLILSPDGRLRDLQQGFDADGDELLEVLTFYGPE